jgi:tartrate dehydrogenase/decarboxylase / D-malate dehydrogenase
VKTFDIALLPGDGIGHEVLVEAIRGLHAVEQRLGNFHLQFTEFPWASDYYFDHGKVVPDNFLDQLRVFDGIFLGAFGDPARLPDAVTQRPLVQIRQTFDQFVCMRPACIWPGVSSPLASPGTIDLVVLRENSEGEYIVCGGRAKQGEPDEIAIQTAVHTRKGVERILRFGFQLAQSRRGRLTMITKSNALIYGMALWDDVLETIQTDYPQVETARLHADAAAMDFVRRPSRFDVVVASNLFGDVLTDLASAVTGGLGLAPSANINPERRFPSLFEPVHGSAPDIAGKGIANPIAAILSSAMMLDWLGLADAALIIRSAVEHSLASGAQTFDLGGKLQTHEMTDEIIARITRMDKQ